MVAWRAYMVAGAVSMLCAVDTLCSCCADAHAKVLRTLTGVEAEAELLAAIVTFFQRLGLGPADVGLKVSSRKVLQVSGQRFCC